MILMIHVDKETFQTSIDWIVTGNRFEKKSKKAKPLTVEDEAIYYEFMNDPAYNKSIQQ